MTDNNKVGSRLPQWMLIKRIFDILLESNNSTNTPRDAEVISLSLLRSKNWIKKQLQEVLKCQDSLSQFKEKGVLVECLQLSVKKLLLTAL